MNGINGFRGEYDFLSNFYPCRITFYEMIFSSVEAAYQAAKCADPQQRKMFCALSASDAKRLGRSVTLRQDWEKRKLTIMHNLLLGGLVTDALKLAERKQIAIAILEGRSKLVGTNSFTLADDGEMIRPLSLKVQQYDRADMIRRIKADMEVWPFAYVDRDASPRPRLSIDERDALLQISEPDEFLLEHEMIDRQGKWYNCSFGCHNAKVYTLARVRPEQFGLCAGEPIP